ncbi:hypothetical protein ACN47E_007868 [Coniothyrium glycines]
MPSFLNTIKAHHDSLNAAYSTYYAPGTSTPSSTATSRNNSVAMPAPHQKKAPTNASKAWSAIKQHHRDMNHAYTAFYSPTASSASSRTSSAAPSPRHSAEHVRDAQPKQPRNYQKAWSAVKNRAVEHHRSVNAAYASTYDIRH